MNLRKKIGALLLTGAMAVSISPTAYCDNNVTEPADKTGWNLVFQEEFNDEILDPTKFSDSYMPHWTTPEQSLAHYDVTDGILSLRIDKETQGPWWAFDDIQKVSSIQTGMRDGMHKFWDTCTITNHHRAVTNFETKYGYFELRARVPNDGGLHSAWWMIGSEEKADETAEIDIFEICGPGVKSDKSRVRVSVHPWRDKKCKEQSLDYYPACDVSKDFHVYGFEWQPSGMKFYFDGKLVKETAQSPDYKMTTFLGIYENNAPLWSGTPDYNSTYPKRFEVDYFRVYKTDEMLMWDLVDNKTPTDGENLAPYAVAGAAQDWKWECPPSSMIDNDAYSAMQSNESPSFPQYLYLDWDEAQSFDTFIMKAAYGKNQAPTNWELEVSADGESGWTTVANSGDVIWNGDDWHVEDKTLHFPEVHGKALRIKINSANLIWNHYAINEVIVKDTCKKPIDVNIATESTSVWSSKNGGLLTDGDYKEAAQSADRIKLPTDIVLSWAEPVSFNQIQLNCWYAQNQAPTKVSLEVSRDGLTWEEIVAVTDLSWEFSDSTIENQVIGFEDVQNVKYLKVKVHEANLKWKHFAINELEVFDRQM